MTEYRTTIGGGGHEYAKLVGDQWVPISEDEARAAGVWHDPRGGQFAVKDPLATPEQLAARDKGFYDPRPASGLRLGRRVIVKCARCGARVAEIHDFEHRPLLLHVSTGRWYWSDLHRWSLYRCEPCGRDARPGSVSALDALRRARQTGKPATLRV